MKRIILNLCILFIVSFAASTVSAQTMIWPIDGPITSPFGYRVHPIYGTEIFHSGIDIGGDYGDAIVAAADGIVTSSGWISGYGNAVIIDHGGGIETLYGHNEQVVVYPGQAVVQGQTIAFCGSTGNSTGPHCHFEVDKDGTPVDPADYLDGTASTSPGLEDFSKSDYNFLPIDFDTYFDFAKPIRKVCEDIAKACTTGLDLVRKYVVKMFLFFICIDFAMSTAWNMFEDNEHIFKFILRKIWIYGILLFIVMDFGIIVNKMRDTFSFMGGSLAGVSDLGTIAEKVSDPSMIVQKGAEMAAPLFSYMAELPVGVLVIAPAIGWFVLFSAVIIFACYCLIGFQVMLAYVEFYITTVFAFICMEFSGLSYTKQYAGQVMNALFAVSLKLLFYSFFVVLMNFLLANITFDNYFTTATDRQEQAGAMGSVAGLDEFMNGLAYAETNGISDPYGYRRPDNGAIGKYQIMPENWDSWAQDAGLPAGSEPTAENQEKVAKHKVMEYYQIYGNWHDVAVAWNGGPGAVGQGWSETESYANTVLSHAGPGISKTINFAVILRMLLVSVMFVFFGSKVSKSILTHLGGGRGFQF